MDKCSFCGNKEPGFLLESDFNSELLICEVCMSGGALDMYTHLKEGGMLDIDIFNMIQKGLAEPKGKFKSPGSNVEHVTPRFDLKPKEIVEKLSEFVIEQDDAKKVLAVAAYNHYKKIRSESELILDTSNVIMLGPTGTGKTFLIETLAKIINVPMIIADATTFTERGFVGESVDDIIANLYTKSGRNITATKHGIVFIDEIDKIARQSQSSASKDMGLAVQQNLLKLLEGGEVNLMDGNSKIVIDTKDILFITSGAFVGLESSGKVVHDDLKAFGLIPEILGRLPIITETKELSNESLVRILKESKSSLIKQHQELFKMEDIELEFTDKALTAIAKMASEKNIGARGLKTIVENIMLDLSFEAPSIDNLEKCLVDYSEQKILRKFVKAETSKEA